MSPNIAFLFNRPKYLHFQMNEPHLHDLLSYSQVIYLSQQTWHCCWNSFMPIEEEYSMPVVVTTSCCMSFKKILQIKVKEDLD